MLNDFKHRDHFLIMYLYLINILFKFGVSILKNQLKGLASHTQAIKFFGLFPNLPERRKKVFNFPALEHKKLTKFKLYPFSSETAQNKTS